MNPRLKICYVLHQFERNGFDLARLTPMPCGIDPARLRVPPGSLGVAPRPLTVGFVGSIAPHKGGYRAAVRPVRTLTDNADDLESHYRSVEGTNHP